MDKIAKPGDKPGRAESDRRCHDQVALGDILLVAQGSIG